MTNARTLPLHELAVALYASDVPLASRGELRELRDRGELGALWPFAAQGLDRLGDELAWWHAWRTCMLLAANPDADRDDPEFAAIWPDAGRHELAVIAAALLLSGARREHAEHGVRVGENVLSPWDVEHARRYPHRAAADPVLSPVLALAGAA